MSGNGCFGKIVVCDFEYEAAPGDFPHPLCMVAFVLDDKLRHERTVRLWRGDFPSEPPFDIGPDTLFVAYSAWAELTCFLQLGWRFPKHIFDLHTCYLAATNILLPYDPDDKRNRPRKRLSDACKAYSIEGWERIEKDVISKDIGEGRWHIHGREACLQYCEEDVRASAELLRRQLRQHRQFQAADVRRVLHWSNYSAKTICQIQAKGMPIDVGLWHLVQENKARVIKHLLSVFDPSYGSDEPIYNAEGEWNYERFERYLARTGVTVWPHKDSGRLDISSDAFKLMSHVPGMERLHALRDSLGVIAKARLPIGRDGRNRPSLFPFGTASGRNAHAKSLFNCHAGMRGFMLFPEDTVGVYLDWRTQEVGIAAAYSGDKQLIEDYSSGDVYHALARMCGLTDDPDPASWKKRKPGQRQKMKSLQLGLNYGMGVPSLARGLDRHPLIASYFIAHHQRRCPMYWAWREDQAWKAMLNRRAESRYGWPLHITTSPNRRTLYNFPMQSGGAEMLRLAAWRMVEAGLIPSMLIHDGILIEAHSQEDVNLAIEIMREAGRATCDGLEIGVDIDQGKEMVRGQRFRDKRPVAQEMWAAIMQALKQIGALPWSETP